MCPPKPKVPSPQAVSQAVPKTPPPPAETAGGIKSKGSGREANAADNQNAARRGTDRLRVDLNVPGAETAPNAGGFGGLLARLF